MKTRECVQLAPEILLGKLRSKGLLIYHGNHVFTPAYEQLFSNEFDWLIHKFPQIETDIVFGFGTNSLWDIALQNKSESIVVADWSPWPIIAHAFICSPLIKIANSPQEFILLTCGLPAKTANGLSLENAFALAKKFTLSKVSDQKDKVQETLIELENSRLITDLELQFLTSFLAPRLGINLNAKSGYGPFPVLRSPDIANISYFLDRRYNPTVTGESSHVFSTIENFNYLKDLFLKQKITYAMADVMDIEFYKKIISWGSAKKSKSYALSVSNIFDCGYYNNLTLENLAKLKSELLNLFNGCDLQLYQTLNLKEPRNYFREKLL